MNNKADIQIIYNKFCPYAQRALITAIEKDLPVQFIKTGLGDQTKTPYFTQTYSKALGRDEKVNGKVPVLVHNGRVITESQLICWYLAEEFQTGSALIPNDRYQRAKMRLWISGINKEMISIFDRAKFRKVESIQGFIQEINAFLGKVEQTIQGDYLLKYGISLADLMIYPWFQRWVIIEHYFGVGIAEKYVKIHNWLKNMNGRRSILQTKKMTDNKYYIERTAKMRPRL